LPKGWTGPVSKSGRPGFRKEARIFLRAALARQGRKKKDRAAPGPGRQGPQRWPKSRPIRLSFLEGGGGVWLGAAGAGGAGGAPTAGAAPRRVLASWSLLLSPSILLCRAPLRSRRS